MIVRAGTPADASAAAAIHHAGVATGEATFRTHGYTPEEWLATYAVTVVAEEDGGVIGWAGAFRTSARAVYAGVGEISVYVAPEAAGRGVGRTLLVGLIAASEAAGFWTLWSHAFADNAGSLAVHRAAGFRILGVRERVGRMAHGPKAGAWRDVVVMERRSTVVGID